MIAGEQHRISEPTVSDDTTAIGGDIYELDRVVLLFVCSIGTKKRYMTVTSITVRYIDIRLVLTVSTH